MKLFLASVFGGVILKISRIRRITSVLVAFLSGFGHHFHMFSCFSSPLAIKFAAQCFFANGFVGFFILFFQSMFAAANASFVTSAFVTGLAGWKSPVCSPFSFMNPWIHCFSFKNFTGSKNHSCVSTSRNGISFVSYFSRADWDLFSFMVNSNLSIS